ncbi:MAG TPA: AAA family ATPase, partial [Polyangiales bacterium]|nr:AAA family ATPase [Polyangiales bacterium]
MTHPVYPWSAVVGQDRLKQALLLCTIDPAIGGVLVQGPRGVAKTTLARSLAELVSGNFVELPLGATEERVTGTLDLQKALRDGQVEFSPGLLARAHEGVLYVDEVNLLADALVDLLLDAAASGRNIVERDGVSHSHAARLVLIGTMNPEEGSLRPQLIDRFGLSVRADEEIAPPERVEIVTRRLEFDRDPERFRARFVELQRTLIERCLRARSLTTEIPLAGVALDAVSRRCHAAGVEGVRADLAMLRAARAHAAWFDRSEITLEDVEAVAELALAHRRRPNRNDPPKQAPPAADGGGSPGAGPSRAGSNAGARAGDFGALSAQPVPIAPSPDLPDWLTTSRGERVEARRRGHPQLMAAGARRGRDRSDRGALDWFSTLARTPKPRAHDLVYRARRAPIQKLWIMLIDCSSSMLRGGALASAKGVAQALEADANRVGAHVALISFRAADARVEVASGQSRADFADALIALAAGGGTSLRAGMRAALDLSTQRRWRAGSIAKKWFVMTDGRSRESLDALVPKRSDLELIVIDCERARVRLGRAPGLSAAIGGSYIHID